MLFGTTEILICAGLFVVIAFTLGLGVLVANISAKKRVCPYCAESIRRDAVVCRFCNRHLDHDGANRVARND